jgi:hypothetical protein
MVEDPSAFALGEMGTHSFFTEESGQGSDGSRATRLVIHHKGIRYG